MRNEANLAEMILWHFAKYPLMQITDYGKLIYQNEFGCGHMIASSDNSYGFLSTEYAKIPHEKPDKLLTEPIGNGLCRIYLSSFPPNKLDDLNEIFISTANRHKGTIESFEEKLYLLKKLVDQKALPIEKSTFELNLNAYKKMGYPPVSHSQVYKCNYKPHYRVVMENLVPALQIDS